MVLKMAKPKMFQVNEGDQWKIQKSQAVLPKWRDVQQLNKILAGILNRNGFRKGSITCQRF